MKNRLLMLNSLFSTRALRFVALGTLAISSLPAGLAAADFFFKDGDRAMILGDSITQQRMYSTLVESYVVSRFPTWEITFRNTGWSGDTMNLRTRSGIDKGFDRDIKPLAPTAVTIDFGMNDARAGDKGAVAYADNARKLADKFSAIGTRMAFVTSSPEERYEAGEPAGSAYNTRLRLYSDELKAVTAERGLLFIDQLNPMIEVIESGRRAGVLSAATGGSRLIPDAVHPNWDGHMVMATSILKGLHAPAEVSSVEIDAKTGVVRAAAAKVSEVKTGDTLSFVRLDDCMPWPVPSSVVQVLTIPGFDPFDELSRYQLKVTGLTAASYEVAADGRKVGTYTKEELAAGVNLTNGSFAALPEVKALFDAITAKNNLFYNRWRLVQVADIPGWIDQAAVEFGRTKKLAELDAELVEADAQIAALAKPQSHAWTVTPVR